VVNGSSPLCPSRVEATQARALRSGRPNIVLWASAWERTALVIGSGGHEKVLTAGSPQWYAVMQKRMHQRVAQFAATGATVVMLTQPPFVDFGNPPGPTTQDKAFERLNTLLTQFAAHTPHVRLINLAAYVCPSGPPCPQGVDGLGPRGDGAHYTSEGSLFVARWLMPQLGIAALDKPDKPLPVMQMVKPATGTVLKGTRLLVAISTFSIGVVKVDFQITGTLGSAVIGASVYVHNTGVSSWDTTSVPNGTYTLQSVASYAGGTSGESPGVSIAVTN
jgi:SGNH domain (fused to AT3 domains)